MRPDPYLLKLYITGKTERSQNSIEKLSKISEEKLTGRFKIVVIDVLENPEQAEEDKILATPTLIRNTEKTSRRIIGDLCDTEKVLRGLGLND